MMINTRRSFIIRKLFYLYIWEVHSQNNWKLRMFVKLIEILAINDNPHKTLFNYNYNLC